MRNIRRKDHEEMNSSFRQATYCVNNLLAFSNTVGGVIRQPGSQYIARFDSQFNLFKNK